MRETHDELEAAELAPDPAHPRARGLELHRSSRCLVAVLGRHLRLDLTTSSHVRQLVLVQESLHAADDRTDNMFLARTMPP